MKISACILTHNNEKTLERLLQSLSSVSEIIIVDDNSTDKTLEIAKKYHAKVFAQKLVNFGAQRNFSIAKAANDWVLVLDSDEVVLPELAKEIKNVLIAPDKDGYYFPRLTYFLGKAIHYSGWYPDYSIRLFNRQKTRFEESIVHEKVRPTKNIGYLKEPLRHYSYANLGQYFSKLNKYTSMQVGRANISKNHLNLILMLGKPFYRFFQMYVANLGFLDGWRGLLLAKLSAYYEFRVHFLAEMRLVKKSAPVLLALLAGFTAVFQGFLIAKFGFLALALPLSLASLVLIFASPSSALIVLFLTVVSGQLTRINLTGSGGIVASDLVVPLFLLSWLAYKIIRKEKFIASPMDNSLIAIIFIFIASFLLAGFHYHSLTSLFYLVRLIMYLSLFWPFYELLHDKKHSAVNLMIFEAAIYLLVLLGFIQLMVFPNLLSLMIYGWDPHKNRMVATFLDPNLLAGFLNIAFAYFLAKFYESEKPWWEKIWPLLIVGLAIALTVSRSGWLMMAIILAIFGLFCDRKIFVIGALIVALAFFFVPRFSQRIREGIDLQGSAGFRLDSWEQGYQLIKNEPLFGVGYNNLEQAKLDKGFITEADFKSHSVAGLDSSLQVLWSTTGIIGLLFYLYWYFKNAFLGFKAYFAKGKKAVIFGLAVGAILIGFLIESLFVNSLFYTPIILELMFVLAVFYNKLELND